MSPFFIVNRHIIEKNVSLKKIALILLTFCLSVSSPAQTWLNDFEEAKISAREEQKLILINFSGSDWCVPCMRLKKEYFNDAEFKEFAEKNLVLFNADFPRNKKNHPPEEIMRQHENLAEKYNPNGAFPFTLIIDPSGKIIKTWEGIPENGLQEFIKELRLSCSKTSGFNSYQRDLILMGSRFIFTVEAENESEGNAAILAAIAEVNRIEQLISSWNPESETWKINSAAGKKPVIVEKELFDLISRCRKISDLTSGAFDISFGSIDTNIWHFTGKMKSLPSREKALASVRLINYQNIIQNEEDHSIFLKEEGMRIGFGAIGKGYAAEQAKKILLEKGIKNGVVNAGGDLTVWGKPRIIGIADPAKKELPFSRLEIADKAIVTSGNYEKFITLDGKKYSHIINPKTGLPALGLQSVTIIGENAELADALATAVFVMGSGPGVFLIDQIPGYEAIIIDDENKIITTSQIDLIK